ncbi:MAG: SPASM domain-containing protein [Clostridia bacterium]
MSNQPLNLLIKPASSLCNMKCGYCFYHAEAMSRESYSHGLMSYETADKLIDRAFEFAQKKPISFAFQGGEPLLSGLDFYTHFVEVVQAKNVSNNAIFYSIQTNGTLINDDWAKFFLKHKFLVGVSLDGNQKANRERRLKEGMFAYGKTIDGINYLTKYGVEYNILCVLTRDIASNIEEVYKYYKESGFKYLQFTPYLSPLENNSPDRFILTTKDYASYLIRLFNLYVKDYIKGNYVSIRMFDNLVQLYLGRPAEQCGMNGFCGHHYVVEGDGACYPCDFYCLDEYCLGNFKDTSFDEMEKSTIATKFISDSFKVSQKCAACKYFKLCHGGCKRYRINCDYCEAYRIFFEACLPLFRVFMHEKTNT